MVNINFKIAREKLSFNALGRTLSKIIKKATKYTDGAGFPGKT
jgi:hypothetical protein